MEKELNYLFIPYEQALELNKLGFDEKCNFYWSIGYEDFKQILSSEKYQKGNSISAPLYQQAFKFFRDKGFMYCINPSSTFGKYQVGFLGKNGWELIKDSDGKNLRYTYEEAETSCLKKLIKLCKEQQNKSNLDLIKADAVSMIDEYGKETAITLASSYVEECKELKGDTFYWEELKKLIIEYTS